MCVGAVDRAEPMVDPTKLGVLLYDSEFEFLERFHAMDVVLQSLGICRDRSIRSIEWEGVRGFVALDSIT